MSELFHKELPKWPTLMLMGEAVTQDQATDILIRTDSFLYGDEYTNEKGFEREFYRLTGLDRGFTVDHKDAKPDYDRIDLYREALEKQLQRIRLTYLVNSWTACTYILGPHGFCSPSGEVFYQDNIGKHPSVEEVYDDMINIAEAFPFLDFKASLYNEEDCEADDDSLDLIVSFVVKDGKVEINETDYDLHQHRQRRDITASFLSRSELGLPEDTLDTVIQRIREATDAVLADPPAME